MKIAYVGNFQNHGDSVATVGTAIVYLMSELKEVESIDVFCAFPNITNEEAFIPNKVKIIPLFDPKKPLSILNIYGIKWRIYDKVIFNLLPTVFGKSSLMNLIGLSAPYFITKFGNTNIRVIYHNSTFTNDFGKLGYNSRIDKIKKIILSKVEMRMFTSLPVYMPLKSYVDKIASINKKATLRYINMRYFEAVPTIYMNKISKNKFIERIKPPTKTVLLHGYWGPQKNLELALSNLAELRNEGTKFYLILSGGINDKFPAYEDYFKELIKRYSNTVDEKLGYVSEKEIMRLFLRSDLVVIPYNTPGGHSGVLETAITFGNNVICVRYPEYEEQSSGLNDIILIDPDNFHEYMKACLKDRNQSANKTYINISDKINEAINSVKELLN